MLAQMIQRNFAPKLGEAQEKLHTVAEAAVVVNSVLDDVANIPLLSESGLDVKRLSDLNNSLSEVGPRGMGAKPFAW